MVSLRKRSDQESMSKEHKIKLAENLNRLMTKKNLTVSAVSRKTGMNKSTLHNYCNGVVPRNLPQIKELADLLDVSLTELIFGSDHEERTTNLSQSIEGKFEITIRRIDAALAKGKEER